MSNPDPSKPQSERRERQDWLIVLLILLLGFACVLVAGQYALRFAPSWQADTDMESNIDLNSDFLTNKPVVFFEPVDPAILTQPGWVNAGVFLTPGASDSFPTGTPLASAGETLVPTTTPLATTPVSTGTLSGTASPTNTLVWIPVPATRTSRPGPGPTNTSPPPLPSADLGITQAEVPPTGTYIPGGVLTYTVTVTNAGPSNVNGATVTDTFTAQVVGATWSCVAVGTTCGAGGPGLINDLVNLPVGATITYTINVNIAPGATGNLVHTATVTLPGGYTETGPLPNVATDTNTRALSANLAIIIDDGATAYVAGDTRTYTITVSNAVGSDNVIGATVNFSPTLVSVDSGSCTPAGGAVCGAWPGTGNINDTVDLPAGSSLTYTVNVTMSGGGNVANSASVTLPAGYLGPSPVSDTDPTDYEIVPVPPPGGIEILPPGGSPDTTIYDLGMGSSLTLQINLTADGNTSDWDLIYYELLNSGFPDYILLDWVQIEISDGYDWYTVFYWGNGPSDGNTNVASFSPENDQFLIPSGLPLYNNSGVAIDIDSWVPVGNYLYIRFTSPTSGVGPPADASTDISAIEIIP